MASKFKEQKYIDQIQRSTGMTFRVRYKGKTKTFFEGDYGNARMAYEFAVKFRDRLVAGEAEIITTKKTVKEVFEEHYEMFPVRSETRRKLDLTFNKYINCKNKNIGNVKAEDIILDLNRMIEIATDNTITRVFSIWRKIVQTALYKEYITKDITLMIKPPKSHKMPHFKVNKVTDRETILKMEELCSAHMRSKHDKEIVPLLLEFLYLTGCRICEALALNRNDIKKDTICISKEIGSSLEDKMVIRMCKTELSVREIPLTGGIKEVIDKACSLHNNDTIFSAEDGSFYNSTILGDRIHRIGKKEGLDFNMYSIRHLFATDLTLNGVDERTRIELMGHSNIKTTLGYARSNRGRKLSALESRND